MSSDNSVWLQTLELVIEESASPERAGSLLKAARVEYMDDTSLTLSLPTVMMKAGVDRSYIDLIKDALFTITNVDMEVTTIVGSSEQLEKVAEPTTPPTPPATVALPSSITPASLEEESYSPKMTFETFVRGDSNLMAYSTAIAVAENPGDRYNPLFIYGKSGLGKTHLLSAINNYVLEAYSNLRTRYFQARDFTQDLADATMKNSWDSFDRKYTAADIILIDDIQFFQGKKESLERFFQLLNDFIDKDLQIVLSSDRAPRDIDMDERMISRFLKGAVTDIQPPTFEMKYNIIKQYLKREMPEVPVTDDVITYIAEISSSNIREIEGALNKLDIQYSLKNRLIDVDVARATLVDFFPDRNSRTVTIDTIQREVQRYFNVTHEEIIGEKRERRISTPRHIAIYLSHELTSESYPSIGKKFGNRDHSTVMHSCSKIEKQIKTDRELFDKVETIRKNIKDKL